MLDSSVDEIKSKLGVEEVISDYLQLKRAGRNLKANCPFHNEKTPSFMVSPERQIWHCFGCDAGGDIFTFVMKIEGVEFPDALKILAQKAGVRLKNANPKITEKKSRISDVIDVSKRFYQECLKIKTGKKAGEYLKNRGLKEEIIKEFQLGYAPDSWDLLGNFLKKKGFSEQEIFSAGMTVRKDAGGYYDRFRGRIMFPINNIGGQTIGFSSRVMPGGDESQAKYINTPEIAIYKKSRVLYGLDRAKVPIRKENLCVMVEGNMDVIASFQAGVKNVVATSGTALTSEQLKIIKRYTKNISFAFDTDSAGIKAANRGIELALAEGMNVSVISVSKGKDPADCVKEDPELWVQSVKKQKPVMEFYFDSVFSAYSGNGVEDKKKAAEELLSVISRISNKIEQSHYLKILSKKMDVDERVLSEELRRIRSEFFRTAGRSEKPAKENITEEAERESGLQEKLLGFIIVCPKIFEKNIFELEDLFYGSRFEEIYGLIKSAFESGREIDKENLERMKEEISKGEFYSDKKDNFAYIWDTAALGAERELEEIEKIHEEILMCEKNLRTIKLQKDLRSLEKDIKKAEEENDKESQKFLMEEFNKRMDELGKIN